VLGFLNALLLNARLVLCIFIDKVKAASRVRHTAEDRASKND